MALFGSIPVHNRAALSDQGLATHLAPIARIRRKHVKTVRELTWKFIIYLAYVAWSEYSSNIPCIVLLKDICIFLTIDALKHSIIDFVLT